ncbi:DEKNAAC104769 [Brettanomyces naardenensis]|uniref:Probable NADPH dehydrogenase n=1 Tax=Brettanomyces naardenensis TaxID=13370 RepID=A0A448YRS4_BRENA|nr:DEKNAAC104769 [Brettanomyces naardenensis]
MSLADTNLFKPIKVGGVTLKNRLVYPPTTRFRNGDDFVATDSFLLYYKQRAADNGGLLIVEATAPAPGFGLYANEPVIDNERQVEAFRQVVEAVHSEGSFISLQIWGLGRTADAALLKKNGLPLIAPSAIYYNEATKKAAEEAGNPIRALTIEEIHSFVKGFADGAKKAIKVAKFDFIEIHAAHGYLVDQFTNAVSNTRTDEYGGSIENRARFLLEVVDAVTEAVGAEHVGIRLSPYATFQGIEGVGAKINPIVTYGYILSELERRAKEGKRLAYLSFVEPRVSGPDDVSNPPKVDSSWVNEIWKGPIIRSGAFLHDEGYSELRKFVGADDRTLIGVSRYYTSNPDLASRLRNGYPLTHYDRPTFYTSGTNRGYLTFARYGEKIDEEKVLEKVPKVLA